MSSQKMPCFRVSVPLSGRARSVVATTALEAVEAVLSDTGLREDHEVSVKSEGPRWKFFEIDPPLPPEWLGNCPAPKTVTNPGVGISVIETEERGEMIVVLGGSENDG